MFGIVLVILDIEPVISTGLIVFKSNAYSPAAFKNLTLKSTFLLSRIFVDNWNVWLSFTWLRPVVIPTSFQILPVSKSTELAK